MGGLAWVLKGCVVGVGMGGPGVESGPDGAASGVGDAMGVS